MTDPNRNLSDERKAAYYAGMIISVIGFLTFGSVFVSGAIGEFSNFESDTRSMAVRAVVGMGMMIVGAIVMSVGSRGLHGSGVLIDPQRQRKDLEPWARMQGGMADDALSEMKTLEKIADRLADGRDDEAKPEVKVRCRSCSALNDEAANFCNRCGSKL